MPKSTWSRPASVPFPTVWRRCNGLRPLSDGTIPKFFIQDVTEDLEGAVMDNLATHLLRDEPMCASCGLISEMSSDEEIREVWREMLKQRVALVALMEGAEGEAPVVVGCNLTSVTRIQDKDQIFEFQGEPMRKVIAALNHIEAKKDVFQHYGVTEYMTALGLSVSPEFRGQGLGLELLRARFDLGRAVGLPLTVTVFTAISSQILAARVGMEVLAEVEYDQYKVDGKLVFPGVATKSFKLMGKRIEQDVKNGEQKLSNDF